MTEHEHDHDHEAHDPDGHEGHQHGHELPPLDPNVHREQGVALFNGVWQMLDMPDRTPAQDDQMVHAAHASRWHWSQAGPLGGDQQLAIGEWQCSRVYSVLGRGEPAVHHAQACLSICEEADLGGWVIAAAYEALTRAWAATGDSSEARAWMERARTATARIADPEDREVIEGDLASLATLPIFGES